MPSKDRFGKAYQVCELTDNENRLIEFITKAQNTSGGDGDEFYELVIKKIVKRLIGEKVLPKQFFLLQMQNHIG